MKDFNYKVPKHLRKTYLQDPFYVVMNKHYIATVRNLESFIEAIKTCGIDDNFGEITKESSDKENMSHFYHYLMEIICEVKGFPSFNSCKHSFVQCDMKKQTISIKTKSGKMITVCVMEDANCIDIQYVDPEGPTVNNGSEEIPVFKMIGFNVGSTPVKATEVTLATILLK